MALYKEIELEDGVTVSYHRINTLNVVTNIETIIEITSYLSPDKRQEQKDMGQDHMFWSGYNSTRYVSAPYLEDFSIKSAYKWLQENDELLAGAEDA